MFSALSNEIKHGYTQCCQLCNLQPTSLMELGVNWPVLLWTLFPMFSWFRCYSVCVQSSWFVLQMRQGLRIVEELSQPNCLQQKLWEMPVTQERQKQKLCQHQCPQCSPKQEMDAAKVIAMLSHSFVFSNWQFCHNNFHLCWKYSGGTVTIYLKICSFSGKSNRMAADLIISTTLYMLLFGWKIFPVADENMELAHVSNWRKLFSYTVYLFGRQGKYSTRIMHSLGVLLVILSLL